MAHVGIVSSSQLHIGSHDPLPAWIVKSAHFRLRYHSCAENWVASNLILRIAFGVSARWAFCFTLLGCPFVGHCASLLVCPFVGPSQDFWGGPTNGFDLGLLHHYWDVRSSGLPRTFGEAQRTGSTLAWWELTNDGFAIMRSQNAKSPEHTPRAFHIFGAEISLQFEAHAF